LLDAINSTNTTDNSTGNPDGMIPGPDNPADQKAQMNFLYSLVNYSVETLPIIGCLVVISIYLFNVRSRNFALKLITYISFLYICETILNIVNDILKDQTSQFNNTQSCSIIGLIREILNVSTMVWIVCISWFMLKAAQNKLEHAQNYERYCILLSILLPLGIGLGYYPVQAYGSSDDYGEFCWIQKSDNKQITNYEFINAILNATALLYGPFVLTMILTITFLYKALGVIRSFDVEEDQYKSILKRFLFFPVLFGIGYVANGLYVYMTVAYTEYSWVKLTQILLGRSQGFFIMLYQYMIKKSDFVMLWRRCFGNGNGNPGKSTKNSILQKSFFSKFVSNSQAGIATFIGETTNADDESRREDEDLFVR